MRATAWWLAGLALLACDKSLEGTYEGEYGGAYGALDAGAAPAQQAGRLEVKVTRAGDDTLTVSFGGCTLPAKMTTARAAHVEGRACTVTLDGGPPIALRDVGGTVMVQSGRVLVTLGATGPEGGSWTFSFSGAQR